MMAVKFSSKIEKQTFINCFDVNEADNGNVIFNAYGGGNGILVSLNKIELKQLRRFISKQLLIIASK